MLYQVYPLWQIQIGIAAHTIFRKAFQWFTGFMAEALIIQATYLSVSGRNYYSAHIIKYLPELTEIRPVGRPFNYKPELFFFHFPLWRYRAQPLIHSFRNLF